MATGPTYCSPIYMHVQPPVVILMNLKMYLKYAPFFPFLFSNIENNHLTFLVLLILKQCTVDATVRI